MTISKILVVDDTNTDRVNLQYILQEAGYQVVTAASGREAVEKVASERPRSDLHGYHHGGYGRLPDLPHAEQG
ncbi:MAG: CheY-like chemotaxis protein [Gammaproteobacteria bacterium]|jgi:CheY-like chemotaxis protein